MRVAPHQGLMQIARNARAPKQTLVTIPNHRELPCR